MEENIYKTLKSKMLDTSLNLYRQIIAASRFGEEEKNKLYSNIIKNYETELTININSLDEVEKNIKKEIINDYKDYLIYFLMDSFNYMLNEYNKLKEEICKQ